MSSRARDVTAASACALLAAAVLTALGLWRGLSFWNPSDGIYAMSARLVLDGLGLYTDVAAAQPPPVYLAGAGLLALDDSATALRAGLEAWTLLTALLVFAAVLRLSGRRVLAVAAGVAAPLTPVMLHENALLTPETLGAPVLLGVALLVRHPRAAGAAGAVAVAIKLSFALPVLAVLLWAPARRRGLAVFALAGLALAALGTAIWGLDVWRGIVVAQGQSGWTAPAALPGLLAQEAWNALPLAAGALVALALRDSARDPVLLGAVAVAAAGALALGLSVVKQGSYVNTIQAAEPLLLVLGVCGAAWAFERAGRARLVAAAALVLLAAQSASLLLSPADPVLHTRPFAAEGPRRLLAEHEVRAFARAAEACPATAPYPGVPWIAFVAERRVPGDQPDAFILGAAEYDDLERRAVAERAAACPADAPVGDG
jgi:hypothetical protein